MPHSVSSVLLDAIYKEGTERVFIVLIEISHSDLDAPLRFTSDGQDTVSNGVTYQAYPFNITLPTDDDGAQPTATFRIANVDKRIVEAVRSLTTAPTFKIWVVLDDNPNRVERGPWKMSLEDFRYDANEVSARITVPSLLSEPFPANTYNTVDYPGL